MKSSGRLEYLDSARGLAAYSVLIYHVIDIKWGGLGLSHWLSILFNGGQAVSFFFVLSGLVLSYKYVKDTTTSFPFRSYIIARVFRLYPAFWFSLVFCVLYPNGFSLGNLADMIGNKYGFLTESALIWGKNVYNGADWTLTIELICSLLFPFFFLPSISDKRYAYVALGLIFLFPVYISAFFIHFVLGLIVAHNFRYYESGEFKQSTWFKTRWLWLAVCIVLFSLPHLAKIYPSVQQAIDKIQHYTQQGVFTWSAFASFGFLVFIISSERLQWVLELRALTFLGKISYSVYLIHVVFVWYWFPSFYTKYINYFPVESPILCIFISVVICSLLTIPAATFMYYFIEKPSIQLGRKVVAKLDGLWDNKASQ